MYDSYEERSVIPLADENVRDGNAAEGIDRAARALALSSRTVVLTGAGISKESGIPTFRDLDGIWTKYRAEELASREGFLSNPALVWNWYMERRTAARAAQPNSGHRALARLETLLPVFLLVTQNVDNLHLRAGNREIVELHGNIERYRCFECGKPSREDDSWSKGPPRCACGGLIRPNIVWFGEPLPAAELECSYRETQRCDALLIVGTSGIVHPAAMLPSVARQSGAFLIEVNVDPSGITPIVDVFLAGKAGKVLPGLVRRVEEFLAG